MKAVQELHPDNQAVVELVLTGNLNLNRIAVDQAKATEEIAQQSGIFAVSIDMSRLNIGSGFAPGGSASADLLPRDELERLTILQLVSDQPLWGLQDEQQAFADLFYELKELVREGRTGEAIASQIGTSPLVEKIRLARTTAAPVAPPQIPQDQVAVTEEIL